MHTGESVENRHGAYQLGTPLDVLFPNLYGSSTPRNRWPYEAIAGLFPCVVVLR